MADTSRKRRPRRQFTDESKTGVVRLILDEGKTVGAVARDLDLTETAVREWVKRARADRTHGRTGLTTDEREELARLRKENRELRTERDILKNVVTVLKDGVAYSPARLFASSAGTVGQFDVLQSLRALTRSRVSVIAVRHCLADRGAKALARQPQADRASSIARDALAISPPRVCPASRHVSR